MKEGTAHERLPINWLVEGKKRWEQFLQLFYNLKNLQHKEKKKKKRGKNAAKKKKKGRMHKRRKGTAKHRKIKRNTNRGFASKKKETKEESK